MVEECLADVGAAPGDLGALVVGIGPGTFTGVRIGVATARAAALALEVPVVGVSTLAALAAMAARGPERPDLIVPVCDARRGQVFAAFYQRDDGNEWRRADSPVVLDPAVLSQETVSRAGSGRAVLVGDTWALGDIVPDLPSGLVVACSDVAAEWLVDGQERLSEPGDGLGGRRLGPWLFAALGNGIGGIASQASTATHTVRPGAPGSSEAVVPLYVRAPDADVHITKMRDPWAR